MRGRLLVIGLLTAAFSSTEGASFTVTNTNDSGPGSLRQAILSANSAPSEDTIGFTIAGPAPHSIVLASALPTIDRNVIIDGGGTVVISGANSFRIFVTTSIVTLRNLTLTKGFGSSNDGGAIFNQGTLTIENCKFLENQTVAAWSGGAIVTYGPLTVRNSEFGFNKGGGGGAIYPRFANAQTTITNCNFHDNEAINTSGGGLGGALLAWDGAVVRVRESTFTGNIARQAGGAAFGQGPSGVIAEDCVFTSNKVTATFAEGGAAHIQGGGEFRRCTFKSNNGSRGGALFVASGTTLVASSTFETNWAAYGGAARVDGGTLDVNQVTMHRNGYNAGGVKVNTGGGALSQGGGLLVVRNTTISDSWASYGAAFDHIGSTSANAEFTNVTISGGQSVGSGAIDMSNGTVMATNVTIANNQASFFAAGVSVRGGNFVLKNTIIADSVDRPNLERANNGVITSQGFNLCDDASGATFLTHSGDKVGAQFDPALSPLAANGGSTKTHLPQAGSPVIDNATSLGAPPADQRGVTRPKGVAFDIGAVEVQPSDLATPTPTPSPTPPGKLANIATRLRVETGDNVLIGGFIITGSQPKRLIVRALGPSLPVAGAVANPQLEIYRGDELVAANDNWRDAPNQQEVIDSTVAPASDLEAAVLTTLVPAAYTAIVRGADGQSGVGSVEAYDLDLNAASGFANISTRGFVQSGDDVMIGGLIIVGNAPRKVIVRAIGPSLGIPGQLEDPSLELFDANGVAITSNDNWRDTQQAEIEATTIPPSNGFESAIVTSLAPAAYTTVVQGVNGTTGVALVEVYALP